MQAPDASEPAPGARAWLPRLIARAWWLHSFWALAFGVGVMVFARKGLAYADEILMVLLISWLTMFVALRTIVGPQNRAPNERMARRGVRVVTNYVIKQFYQQMFFFLVPLYASSATWQLTAYNWWLAPLLLTFAVLSTMDLVFDNFIMERRRLASVMYGVAMFGVLNVMLPVVFRLPHFDSLLLAAGATAPAVALLSFRVRTVFTLRGLTITLGVSAGLVAAAWYGRAAVPPTPISLAAGAVGHGAPGEYECLPAQQRVIRADQLTGLRCGSLVVEPGGVSDGLVHVWRHGRRVVHTIEPHLVPGCEDEGTVYRSYLPPDRLPASAAGKWSCLVKTADGQLVGRMRFEVRAPESPAVDAPGATAPDAPDAGPAAAGAADAGAAGRP